MDYVGRSACALSHAVVVELLNGDERPSRVEAELQYHPGDPYAVTVTFSLGNRQIRWIFARELVANGLYEPTGEGDVQVQPGLDEEGRATVLLLLTSPQGRALVQARAREIRTFVERMSAVVPFGLEHQHVDLDAALTALVGDPRD